MKKVICVALCLTIFLGGCAGRAPNPIQTRVPGDENLSCDSLEAQMAQIQKDITEKEHERSSKTTGNVVLGVLGFFLIVPLFFMDLKDAEGTEIQALKQRYQWLGTLATEKGCDFYHPEQETR
jgi:hypothetical protein